jgi:opacity protein-like surface antigen
MKKLLLIAAAAAAVAVAAPASAQVHIRAGEHGVGVRVGGPAYHGYHRNHYRGHYARGNCRVMRSRTVTPSGRVIVKTRRVCR